MDKWRHLEGDGHGPLDHHYPQAHCEMTGRRTPRTKRRHDIMSREKRSALMARIRSKDTRIEKLMEQALAAVHVNYEKNPKVFGKPDFAVLDRKVAVFCDGDFWHGYQLGRNPRLDIKDNRAFWMVKIRSNIKRDRTVNEKLAAEGWSVLRFWEHDIKADPMGCAKMVMEKVTEE